MGGPSGCSLDVKGEPTCLAAGGTYGSGFGDGRDSGDGDGTCNCDGDGNSGSSDVVNTGGRVSIDGPVVAGGNDNIVS